MSHVINTHGHPDHINGNARVVEMTRAPVAAHPLLRPDVPLADGQRLDVGALTLRCLHVPGHCEDHIALYEETHRLLITGDLLFVGKVGGTSSDEAARTSGTASSIWLPKFLTRRPSGPDTTTGPGPHRRWPSRNPATRFCCAATRRRFSS